MSGLRIHSDRVLSLVETAASTSPKMVAAWRSNPDPSTVHVVELKPMGATAEQLAMLIMDKNRHDYVRFHSYNDALHSIKQCLEARHMCVDLHIGAASCLVKRDHAEALIEELKKAC